MCPGLPQVPPTARKPLEPVEQREGRSEACLRQAHAPTCSQTRLTLLRSSFETNFVEAGDGADASVCEHARLAEVVRMS